MKIALEVFGHYRSFPSVAPSWKHLFDNYDTDIFIHSWTNRGQFTPQSFEVRDETFAGAIRTDDDKITEDDFLRFLPSEKVKYITLEDYSIVRKVIEQDIKPYYEWRNSLGPPYNLIDITPRYSQLRKNYYCNQLKQQYEYVHGVKYDMVISTRPDIAMVFPEKIELPEPDTVLLRSVNHTDRWVDELIRVADNKTMNKVNSLFWHYKEIYEYAKNVNNPHCWLDLHGIVYQWCNQNEITMETSPIWSSIVR